MKWVIYVTEELVCSEATSNAVHHASVHDVVAAACHSESHDLLRM